MQFTQNESFAKSNKARHALRANCLSVCLPGGVPKHVAEPISRAHGLMGTVAMLSPTTEIMMLAFPFPRQDARSRFISGCSGELMRTTREITRLGYDLRGDPIFLLHLTLVSSLKRSSDSTVVLITSTN